MIKKNHKHDDVRSRNEKFAEKTATKICQEVPSEDNPYIAKKTLCHGYDIIELMRKKSFTDVFFLLFKGELPSKDENELLEALMIALINPGPRHPATRAAMSVGIGKTNNGHILPIASSILSGEYRGGGCIEASMRFFRKNQKKIVLEIYSEQISKIDTAETAWETAFPGFGSIFGGVDIVAGDIAKYLNSLKGAGLALKFGSELVDLLKPHGIGWSIPGVAAAVFADLGFQPRSGISLFQLLSSPGLVAHGLELSNKPITSMPYVSDENYVIEK